MKLRSRNTFVCVAACLAVLALSASAAHASGCICFDDPAAFTEFNELDGKYLKGIETFEESNIGPGGKQPIPEPLQGLVPNVDPGNGIGFPGGLLEKQIIIQTNLDPGPNPPNPNPCYLDPVCSLPPTGPAALYVAGPGFIGSNSTKVGEDLGVLFNIPASTDILFRSGVISGVGFELGRFQGFGTLAGWHMTMYDSDDNEIDKCQVPGPPAPEPSKAFFGVWCDAGIGRINVFDKEPAPTPDSIDNIQMWVDPLAVHLASFTATTQPDGTVRVGWATAAELDNAGFRVLRAVRGEKPGKDGHGFGEAVVISDLIPARGTELAGADYEFVDAAPATTGPVRYYLEDVDHRGYTTRHGPVQIKAAGGKAD